jgi:hypothetical protein
LLPIYFPILVWFVLINRSYIIYKIFHIQIFVTSILDKVVKTATCFTKIAEPSLLDVIITNRPNHCQNIRSFNCGLSDCHNIISFQLKGYVPFISTNIDSMNLHSSLIFLSHAKSERI